MDTTHGAMNQALTSALGPFGFGRRHLFAAQSCQKEVYRTQFYFTSKMQHLKTLTNRKYF